MFWKCIMARGWRFSRSYSDGDSVHLPSSFLTLCKMTGPSITCSQQVLAGRALNVLTPNLPGKLNLSLGAAKRPLFRDLGEGLTSALCFPRCS